MFAATRLMVPQSIIHIPEICHRHGIQHAVLSPGSRSAPISIAFARHPDVSTEVIDDERTAAFVGFGKALESGKATVLVCTSGSAGYNYAPAVAEAFFQQVPLLVITADRPPEWIDQWDGQTIRQQNLFGDHVKAAYQLPVDTNHPDAQWQADRILSEAILMAQSAPCGPVHLNVPLREPFYPESGQNFEISAALKVIHREEPQLELSELQWNGMLEQYHASERILIVAGQHEYNHKLLMRQDAVRKQLKLPVMADIISNLQVPGKTLSHQDLWLGALSAEEKAALRPDLLITYGKSVISKQAKLWLRANRPKAHWHIQPHIGPTPDPFQSLTKVITLTPWEFLRGLEKRIDLPKPSHQAYGEAMLAKDQLAAQTLDAYFQGDEHPFTEFDAVHDVLAQLPALSDLHLANSMAVRYANFVGLSDVDRQIRVFANRGTSGIDGSNSTQRGAYAGRLSVLLTGDMAFFYDRNAWWGTQPPAHIRIVVLNNHGGGIFRMIKGPRQQPELEYLFDTEQPLKAERMADEWGMEYQAVHTREGLAKALPQLLSETTAAPQLLEIFTDKATNTEAFDGVKQLMRETYGA